MIKMRRKSITNAMLCIAASLSLVFAVFFAFGVPDAVNAEKATVNDTAVSKFYFSGDEIELPLTADIVSDGVTYEGKFTALIMPDGNAVSESSLTLTDTGAYKVCFAYEKVEKDTLRKRGSTCLKRIGKSARPILRLLTARFQPTNRAKTAPGLRLNLPQAILLPITNL